MGAARRGASLLRPSTLAAIAVVMLLLAAWTLRLSPADAADAVAPALQEASDHAARTGVPATVWAFDTVAPDPQAPLTRGLDALPDDVEVWAWPPPEPRHHAEGWRHVGLLEVEVAGRPGRSCLVLRPANPASVVRIGVHAAPSATSRAVPRLTPCAEARRTGQPALVYRDGSILAASR